jgi:DNA (cytosine-5)-methyltransferase 1
MNELALFAGAGGGILGGKLLGWRTVCAVEWDAYARDVLVARQNDGCLYPFPVWDDVQTFDGAPWRGSVDVVSGGFPCQDISSAGKGAGIDGERSGMWKQMARICGEIRPRFILVENSPMLVGRGLAVVLSDLAEMGYDATWGVVGAHHAGAPHKRDRIWIVATDATLDAGEQRRAECAGLQRASWSANGGDDTANAAGSQDHAKRGDCQCGRNAMGRTQQTAQCEDWAPDNILPCGCGGLLADARGEGLQRIELTGALRDERHGSEAHGSTSECGSLPGSSVRHAAGEGLPHGINGTMGQPGTLPESERSDWWATEPDVGRVAHGVAARVDRLRCIGNGQVSGVVPIAWRQLLSQMNDKLTHGGPTP